MEKINLDMFDLDDYPREAKKYFKNNGIHFNKRAVEYACEDLMRKNPATGKLENIDVWDKDKVDELLKKFNVKLEHSVLYDYVFVCNMARSDYWKSSIADEQHLALFVKDMVDDPDQRDGFIFNRWLSDRMFNGEPIDWDILI